MNTKFLIFILPLFFMACKFNAKKLTVGDDIDDDVRNEMSKINDRVIGHLSKIDMPGLISDFSDKLKKDASNVEAMSNALQGLDFSKKQLLTECHFKSNRKGDSLLHTQFPKTDSGYEITYFDTLSNEYYTSLFSFEQRDKTIWLYLAYSKYGKTWKVNEMRLNDHSLKGKTPEQVFKEAKIHQSNGETMCLLNDLNLVSRSCFKDGSSIRLNIEKEVESRGTEVLKNFNKRYAIPMQLGTGASKPVWLGMQFDLNDEGYFPVFNIITDVNMKDTGGLKKVHDMVKVHFFAMFPEMKSCMAAMAVNFFNKLETEQDMLNTVRFLTEFKNENHPIILFPEYAE